MKKLIRYYIAPNGKAPVLEWLNKIKDRVTLTRIRQRISRLELGLYGDYKVIESGLCELRLDFGAGYRVYFLEEGHEIVILLCGGNKSTQSRDIASAKRYLEELKRRVSHA